MYGKKLLLPLVLSLSVLSEQAMADSCINGSLIEVEGSAFIEVIPDVAVIRLNSIGEDLDATKSQKISEQKLSLFLEKVKKLGLKSEDINSKTVTAYPKYDYVKDEAKLIANCVSREIVVKVSDLKLIDSVIKAAIDSDITHVNGISYEISNYQEYEQKAKLMAIDDAKEKAKILAKGFGVKLSKPCRLKSTLGYDSVNETSAINLMRASAKADGNNLDYIPQKQQVSSNVYASFSFKD